MASSGGSRAGRAWCTSWLSGRTVSDGEGKFHALKVKVGRSGVRWSSRAGYFESRDFRQRTPLERSLSAADVIANEIPVRRHRAARPGDAVRRARPEETGAALVPVLLEIPGAGLPRARKASRTTLEIYVYAFDAGRAPRRLRGRAVSASTRAREPGTSSSPGGIRYFGELRLPPGDYRLRTLVRNANTGRTRV